MKTKKLLMLVTIISALMILGCPQSSEPTTAKIYRVSFKPNGGTGTMEDQIFIENEEQSLKPMNFAKEHHIFVGWATSPDGVVKYSDKHKLTPKSDITLWAVWELNIYTVMFDSNGGTGTMEAQFFPRDEIKNISKNTFTHETLPFFGWAKTPDGTKEYDDEESISITSNMTLYAVWKVALSSITVTPIYTGDYFVGDEITNTDITVMANYNDGTSKPVTTWTTDETFSSEATDKKITISYTEDEITKTDTLTITIVDYKITYNFTETASVLTGHDGTAGKTCTYMEFGDWPQRIKADNVKVLERKNQKIGIFTYYTGSDGNWYVKQEERAYTTSKYSDGSKVGKDGTTFKYFKVEPIKWRVLEERDGKKLLLAENSLMVMPYYDIDSGTRTIGTETIYPNNYKHSKIRAWLNGYTYQKESESCTDYQDKGFLQTAFTSTAQDKITVTEVNNSSNSTTNTNSYGYSNEYACENTNDCVFLLSVSQAAYFKYKFDESIESSGEGNTRIRKPTDFTLASGAHYNSECFGGLWWLRSPFASQSNRVRYVNYNGIMNNPYIVNWEHGTVVPTLWILE